MKRILGFCLLILLISSCKEKINKVIEQNEKLNLIISGPDTAFVGQKITLKIPTDECINPWIIREDAWGIDQIPIKNTNLNYIGKNSGLSQFNLLCDGNLESKKDIYFKPQKAAYPLYSNVGAKSILANGVDWASFVTIPEDKFGNPVADGTPVNYKLFRPNLIIENRNAVVKNGISSIKIISSLTVGKTITGAIVDGVATEEKELIEEAGFPINFLLSVVSSSLIADGRQTFRIKTSEIKDNLGNNVVDGTVINFIIRDANGSIRQLKGYTLNGMAIIDLQNPLYSGELSIFGEVHGGGESNVLKLNFNSLIKEIPFGINEKTKEIIIGPLIGELNQLVPNGTEVEVKINNKTPFITNVEDGKAIASYKNIYSKILMVEIRIGNTITKKQFNLE